MAELSLLGGFPDKVYAKLERVLGFKLGELQRWHIEAGINFAVIDREVLQLDRRGEKRALYAELEQAATALDNALGKALTPAHIPLWVVLAVLDVDEVLRNDILRIHPDAYFDLLVKQVRLLKRGAKAMLKDVGRGAPKRRERAIVCRYVAEALGDAAAWPEGTHDAKVVAGFARIVFPYVPKSVAHKSAQAFAEDICKAFKIPRLSRAE
jgi:hypothetical protein